VRAIQSALIAALVWASGGAVVLHSHLCAQGVTTGVIRGTVSAAGGTDVEGARVSVKNTVTGFSVESKVQRGRFLVPGLEIGGPYTITIERAGLLSQEQQGVRITLGQPTELLFFSSPPLSQSTRCASSSQRSGTNQLQGSLFSHVRNDRFARREEDDSISPYDRPQYGFALGGPILRDRLHFFVAAEMQRLTSPARGPYVGQPATGAEPVPVSPAAIARFQDILRGYGLEPGPLVLLRTVTHQRVRSARPG
jgi:hypothetical protein